MKSQVYKTLVEQTNRLWLADKLDLTSQQTSIDLISEDFAVELKSHDTHWKKNSWAYDTKQVAYHERETKGLIRWFAAMEYDVWKRPKSIRSVRQARSNVTFRNVWMVPWIYLEQLEPSVGTKKIWKYPKKSEFLDEYDFGKTMSFEGGVIHMPSNYDEYMYALK